MPVKQTIPFPDGIFAITFTCYNWLPLIEKTKGYDFVYNWFDILKANKHFVMGYVLMPNHVHTLLGFRKTAQTINTIIGNGKRFIAYSIVQRLKQQNEFELLESLHQSVEKARRVNQKKHEVFEPSFDWKHCTARSFIAQKLDYYHNNPCTGKWNLCESPVDYAHSSAKFYLTGEQGLYPVTSYEYVMGEVDLTK